MNPSVQMPYELHYMILAIVFADSIHAVCFSQKDITWELNALRTLSCVSRSFREICGDICAKAFGPPIDEQSVASVVHPKLNFLRSSARIEGPFQPIMFDEESINTPFLQAYLLLLSLLQLRKSAKDPVPTDIFKRMFAPIKSSAAVLEVLCAFAEPKELYANLYTSYLQQMALVSEAVPPVYALNELEMRLAMLKQSETNDQIYQDELAEIGPLLLKFQSHATRYMHMADKAAKFTGPEVKFHELPGMLAMLRQAASLRPPSDESENAVRVFVKEMRRISTGCPTLEY